MPNINFEHIWLKVYKQLSQFQMDLDGELKQKIIEAIEYEQKCENRGYYKHCDYVKVNNPSHEEWLKKKIETQKQLDQKFKTQKEEKFNATLVKIRKRAVTLSRVEAESTEGLYRFINGTAQDKEEVMVSFRLLSNACAKLDGSVSCCTQALLYRRIHSALTVYNASEGNEADVEVFKKSFKDAIDIYSLAFRKYGDASLVNQVKAAGMTLLGVIVTLLTSPAFLVPMPIHDHSQWLKRFHFFAGAETNKSKAVQIKMNDEFISDLVKKA